MVSTISDIAFLRTAKFISLTKLLVFWPIYFVASKAEYVQYATLNAPCIWAKILRNFCPTYFISDPNWHLWGMQKIGNRLNHIIVIKKNLGGLITALGRFLVQDGTANTRYILSRTSSQFLYLWSSSKTIRPSSSCHFKDNRSCWSSVKSQLKYLPDGQVCSRIFLYISHAAIFFQTLHIVSGFIRKKNSG